jgi:LruC domain-containing protein
MVKMNKCVTLSGLLLAGILVFLAGCSPASIPFKSVEDLEVPSNFNYRTTKVVTVTADLGADLSMTAVQIYAAIDNSAKEDYTDGDYLWVGSATTDVNGQFVVAVNIPTLYTQVELRPMAIVTPIRATIIGNTVTMSKSKSHTSRAVWTDLSNLEKEMEDLNSHGKYLYYYGISAEGRPSLVQSVDLDPDFIKEISTLLPEYKKIPLEFLGVEKSSLNIKTDETVEVWVTFVHEGSSYRNALGFYTYPTGSPPTTRSEIADKLTIIFPNTSYVGGGGKLGTGDTMYIGEFNGDTSIGWVLFADGWSPQGSMVKDNARRGEYFSDNVLNPNDKKYSVIFYDESKEAFIIGFEDMNLDDGKSDEDYNDVVILVTATPLDAVENKDDFISILGEDIEVDKDTDDDLVPDSKDFFPEDDRYTTLETFTGTLAYEDLWPELRDYDFNDLVVNYQYKLYGDATNKIPRIDMEFTVLASGAGFRNGLAMTLPVLLSEINNVVEGTLETPIGVMDDVEIDEDDTTGRTRLILIPDAKALVKSNPMFNTKLEDPIVDPASVTFSVVFESAIARNALDDIPFDVYLLADNTGNEVDNNIEVHLPDVAPTKWLMTGLMGTMNDDSKPSEDRYYKNQNNLPWALHVPGEWIYPIENRKITEGYNYFGAWAESGGLNYTDWYMDKPNYMVTENLYIR